MARPMKKLPPSEDATLGQAHNEIVALAQWSRKMGFANVTERLDWIDSVVAKVMAERVANKET